MAIISSYTIGTQTVDDYLIGTDDPGGQGPTKNFTLQSIINLVSGSLGDNNFYLSGISSNSSTGAITFTVTGGSNQTLTLGTAAFKAGSSLARNALTAKKAGTYWKPTKTTAGQLEKTLTNKGRMLTTLGGAGGIGISDAIFVGDAERVGTLGDAFNIGPTQLAENDENVASRTVLNRVKFGLDSALLGGIIGGTGTAIKQAVQRSNKLNRNNDFIDTILEYTTPQGKKSKEFFEMEREMIGLRSADVNRAQELHRQIDKQIDALYPFLSRAFRCSSAELADLKPNFKAISFLVGGIPSLEITSEIKVKISDCLAVRFFILCIYTV
mgnify:CR=1 FL=1